jgi:hypothetical protein
MNPKMAKMLAGKRDLSDKDKKAKMEVAGALRDDMQGEMKKKLHPMKKVSVIADSDQGLQKGLAHAKQLASSMPSDMSDDDSDEMNMGGESGYDDGGEVDNLDPDKLASAQESMRKAFGYADGGLVNSDSDEELNEDHDGEMGHDQMDDPEGDEAAKYGDEDYKDDADEEANEFHGLDMDEVNDKLQKLMKMKSKMESK